VSDETTPETRPCPHCQGLVEIPGNAVAVELHCPHCGGPLDVPSQRSSPKWGLFWAVVIAAGAAVVGLAYWTFTRPKKVATASPAPTIVATQRTSAPPTTATISTNNFTLSGIGFEKQGALRYLRGTLRNDLTRQRFGVKIQLDLVDVNEGRVGSASDYRAVLQPGEVWQFRALALEPAAVSATLVSITEDQ
jgi:hypothetical protein